MNARRALNAVVAAAAAIMSLAASAQSPPITVRGIHPATPRPFETVNLRVSQNHCGMGPPENIRVEQASGSIQVTIERGKPVSCPSPPPEILYHYEIRLGSFPVGTYTVDVVSGTGDPGNPNPVVTPQRLAFQVLEPPERQGFPPQPGPFTDFSGAWWNPTEGGWGLFVTQSASNQLIVALLHYDWEGVPVWYVAPGGTWQSPWSWSGTLYRTKGPRVWSINGYRFDPDGVERTPVGTAIFNFIARSDSSPNPSFEEISFIYEIDGAIQSRFVRRMEY